MNRFLPPYGVTRLWDSGRTDTFPDTRNLVQAKESFTKLVMTSMVSSDIEMVFIVGLS